MGGGEVKNETRFHMPADYLLPKINLRLIPDCKIYCNIFTNIYFWSHQSFDGRSNVTLREIKEIRVVLKKVCVT